MSVRMQDQSLSTNNAYNEEGEKMRVVGDASQPSLAQPSPGKVGFKEKNLQEKSLGPHHSAQNALKELHFTIEPTDKKGSLIPSFAPQKPQQIH